MNRIISIFFSATDTTRRCVSEIAGAISPSKSEDYNLADNLHPDFPTFSSSDVVIFGSPVYGGRLPSFFADSLKDIKGNGATAVAVVVFGNRDYDDALLELCDLLKAHGFRIAGAGAFIGTHSIFPAVGTGRPDASDIEALQEFGHALAGVIESGEFKDIDVKGRRPYRKPAGVPLHPATDPALCKKCGACIKHCPVGAIDPANPFATDNSVCLSCGRCIHVCPGHARRYSGLTYKVIGSIFKAAFSRRKSPTWTLAH